MDCKTMKKSWWRRKLSFIGRLLGFKNRSTGRNSSTRNEDEAKSSTAAGQPAVGAVVRTSTQVTRTSTQENLKSTQAREHGRAGTLSRTDDRREVSNAVGPASRKKTKTDRNTKKCSVDSAAIDTKMDRPVDDNHTTIVQTRERVPREAKSAASQNERRKSYSMIGNGSCQRREIKKHSAEYVSRLAPAEDHTPSVVNSDLRPGNKNGAGLTASDERRADSSVNEHSLTVTKTAKKVPNGCMSVNEKTGRSQSDINEIKSYQEDFPKHSLNLQRSKTGIESKAVKYVTSKSMTGKVAKIAQHCAEYADHLSPADDEKQSIDNNELRPGNKNGAGLMASDARRSDSPVNEPGLTVTKTKDKILSSLKSVIRKMGRCQSDINEIKSYQEDFPKHSLNLQRSKTGIESKAVKYVTSKTMTGKVAKIAQHCAEYADHLPSADDEKQSIDNSELRPGNKNGADLTVSDELRADSPVNEPGLTVSKTEEKILSGFKSVNKQMNRCKSDKTEIKSCQEGKQKYSINCKWSQIAIDMEPVKYYVGPKTTALNTAITAQNCSEDPSDLAPTDAGTPSIVNSDLRPGNENGAGLPVGGTRRKDGPVNKNNFPVTVKARENVRSVTVKAPTSTKAQKPEVNRGWQRKDVPEKTTKSQQPKTGIDSKAVKCNDLSNTIKPRTAANARIRPAVAARAAPADRTVQPRIAIGNNPRPGNMNGASLPAGGARTGGGLVNKNSMPVTVKSQEKVGPVNVKVLTSTNVRKPEVNRGWRRKDVPETTTKSQQPKTGIDTKAVKCNDLSNTRKPPRTAANARIRLADAARAAPADRTVPPRIVNSNNPRTGSGSVNKNGLPVTVKAREIVRSVTVKAPTSTKTQKPEVNRGWRREDLPVKTAKSQQPKTRIDSKAVKCNTRPKAVKSDARAAVMDDDEPIERDQRRYTTVDDADFTTIDRWADVLIEEDLMMLEEPQIPIIDEFW